MLISLSILEYEPDLAEHVDNLAMSRSLSRIIEIIQTGKIHRLHVDVMRPPIIPNTNKFSIDLIKRLYEELHKKVPLAIHLMVGDPSLIVEGIDGFIPKAEKAKVVVIIQRESYDSEDEVVKALKLLKECGYEAGICLDLPTPSETLTERIIKNADFLLIMSVPMGRGGQKYCDEATRRIKFFSQRFPDKPLEVDGGIDPETIVIAWRAGAREAVVGSFISRNENPRKAIQELQQSLESAGFGNADI